ncbi:MAG: bis(5'-nucleosyl)-tetraphosphatase (symmetrical) YqeK [Solobacterium sp.]|nr:bis(5'-nucleosyl)-tetraphosphatase (symmetrical) YqeK [Solobacterium sp.]
MILGAQFDPVTESEREYILRFRREHGIRDLYVTVSGEGVLDRKTRLYLLERAFRPYRHIHVTDTGPDELLPDGFEQDEKAVRSGCYCLAAAGTVSLIASRGYYYLETLRQRCTAHRYVHSIGTAALCVRLALRHGFDPYRAFQAGLLHDITKSMPEEEQRRILENTDPGLLEMSPAVWHSYTGAYVLRHDLCISDPKILRAVFHHTVGDGKGTLDRILYIADKLEPTRHYDTESFLRTAYEDLAKGAAEVREEAKRYILYKEGKHV